MIKEGKQFIYHNGKEYQCLSVSYFNPIQHKWSFIIDGIDSKIKSGEKITFLDTLFTVCFTDRERSYKTTIHAWIV